jgi:hypothetical protein
MALQSSAGCHGVIGRSGLTGMIVMGQSRRGRFRAAVHHLTRFFAFSRETLGRQRLGL